MANQATTNKHGTVASDNSVANLITIAASAVVQVTISGTGGARLAKNTATASTLTDESLPAGFPFAFAADPNKAVTTLLLYANASESTLTYDIAVAKSATVSTS